MVARVEWHVNNTYPLYSAEANAKWHLYPPPYQGGYATPWLWVDGRNCGYQYNTWENYVYSEMSESSTVSLTHVGTTYDSTTRSGQLKVEVHNADTIAINGTALQFAITEDSIHYTGTNHDSIHNGVLRDYVPNQNGTALTLGPGATDTVTLSYSLQSSWNESKVKLVVYLQNMTVQSDSSMPCYQGSSASVLDFLTGVAESRLPVAHDIRVSVSPNPCRSGCEFAVSGAGANGARVTVYTPDGRLVSGIHTVAGSAFWNRAGLSRGVYLYRVNAGTATAEGKLVVTD